MPTFKAIIGKEKENKTYLVSIQLTHLRKIKYISTGHYVTKRQMMVSKKGKSEKVSLKDPNVIDTLNDTIKAYRAKLLNVVDIQSRSIEF